MKFGMGLWRTRGDELAKVLSVNVANQAEPLYGFVGKRPLTWSLEGRYRGDGSNETYDLMEPWEKPAPPPPPEPEEAPPFDFRYELTPVDIALDHAWELNGERR